MTSQKIDVRKRFEDLSNPKLRLFDDPDKYKAVYFPEFKDKLTVVSPPPDKDHQFNCFAYALGLSEWVPKYTFVKAIENEDLINTITPQEGDVIVYSANGIVCHAGIYVSDSKVRSKWAGGPIFEHDTLDCPAHYGSDIKYYKAISTSKAQEVVGKYPVPN